MKPINRGWKAELLIALMAAFVAALDFYIGLYGLSVFFAFLAGINIGRLMEVA